MLADRVDQLLKVFGTLCTSFRMVSIKLDGVFEFFYFREILANGSLYFPSFSITDYRSDIHSSTYSCSLTNAVGTVLSRECHIHSG